MNPAAKLAGFAAALMVVLLLGWRLGFVHGGGERSPVAPVDPMEDVGHGGHSS